jgi:hypothetical protein
MGVRCWGVGEEMGKWGNEEMEEMTAAHFLHLLISPFPLIPGGWDVGRVE